MAYHFISNGPNAKFNLVGEDLYNFGLGDLDAITGDISNIVNSDNKDVDFIMATVGSIIYDFTNIFPHAMVSIKGTNKARTRLYQMNINKHLG